MGETHPAKIKIFEMADQIIYVDVLITLREKKPATPHVIFKSLPPTIKRHLPRIFSIGAFHQSSNCFCLLSIIKMRKTNSYSTWHEISVRKYFWPSLSWILAPSGLFFRGARGRVVALAKKRRLWRRSTLLCSPSSERRWQLHLPKTVQKCNCLVNAGHNSCQRP